MELKNEIITLRKILNLTQKDLAEKLKVSYESVNKWENEKTNIDPTHAERIYEFAESNGISFNTLYEQLFREELSGDEVLLFHGVKKEFSLPIDFESHSRPHNDFGKGFYLGTTFEQASTYISNVESHLVFCFKLDLTELNRTEYNVCLDWMLAIAYYRGWIEDQRDSAILKPIIDRIERSDIIIAPIADNRMFDIITEFVSGTITDQQCEHALAATNLGKQYVVKSKRALKNISPVKELYVCESEKKKARNKSLELGNNGLQKVQLARIEYKNKGKYFGELFI